ncbi:hypothetical protein GOV13_03325 [Candidatus Pacearchaeota archaeon]|nr:hypothetical protein [Candidatus Pacearchaeota archaeon]
MVNACFYYGVPIEDKKRTFLEGFFSDETTYIENILPLVVKLAEAKEELAKDNRWKVHAGESKFPQFFFNIETTNNLLAASKRLFSITDPLFPYLVESSKMGYSILEEFLDNEYNGSLKRESLALGDHRLIILPKV